MIELDDKIKLRDEVQALYLSSLDDQKKLSESSMMVISGWGDLNSNGPSSDKLMVAKVPYVSGTTTIIER